jgi:hypothetical protein
MNAVQIMSGRGGWPMSVFLTPDLKPFYGGTYWPPTARMGMPGFDQVLAAVADAWQNRREMAIKQAEELTGYLQTIEEGEPDPAPAPQHRERPSLAPGAAVPAPAGRGIPADLADQLLDHAALTLQRAFDPRHGGFGRAPKFPHAMGLQLLLRLWKRQPRHELLEMVTVTLDKMAAGGIYDHLAGGFHRYSVDERWLVPHFEKMLYDNALLTSAYLDAYLATRQERFARVVRETCTYVLRYLTDAAGGFHSTEDADSEGEEGKFYVWTPADIQRILGDELGERFCYVYDVTEAGNFEHGQSILNLPKSIEQCAAVRGWNPETLAREMDEARQRLLAERDRRARPGKDDKVLVSWNGLMIEALARAGAVLGQPHYTALAENAAEFLLGELARPDGRLRHTWRGGVAKGDAFLDDYACLASALVSLYQATFEPQWIDEAVRLADLMLRHFEDRERGGFFFTADDHEQLIARNKDLHDASVPSASAMAATVLLRLGRLCGRSDYVEAAGRTLAAAAGVMKNSPAGASQMLIALDLWRGPMQELVLIGGENAAQTDAAIVQLQQAFLPAAVAAVAREGKTDAAGPLQPSLAGRKAMEGKPTLYVCENFACQAPAVGLKAIEQALGRL